MTEPQQYQGVDPFPLNFTADLLDPDRAILRAKIESELHNEKMIQQLHYMTGVHAKGREYTNFIIAAGYAAYIALWTGVAKDLDPAARLLSGGLIAISLISFLTWEITKMVALMNEGGDLARALRTARTRAELAEEVQLAIDMEEARNIALHEFWPLPFYLSLVTGLVGALLLAIASISEGAYLALK